MHICGLGFIAKERTEPTPQVRPTRLRPSVSQRESTHAVKTSVASFLNGCRKTLTNRHTSYTNTKLRSYAVARCPSVCLSVLLVSVAFVYCVETSKLILKLFFTIGEPLATPF